MRTAAIAALFVTALAASSARADILPPPPPPPPPPGQTVAVVAAGWAAGLAVLGLGLWLARRRARVVV